jgi:type I restriction enzyme, S subunit
MKQGWEKKKLGEVLTIERGGSPRPIVKYLTNLPDGINWIKISDATASDKYIFETKEKITKEGLHKTRMVNEGDFILSNSMSFGRPYIMKTSGCIHDGWLVLKQKGQKIFDTEFLFYLLSSPYVFKQFDYLASGSTVRNLNIALVSSVEIPLPPLPEQQRIVSILDEAFAAIAKTKANAEQNLKNARELFDSYLQGVFEKKGDGWEEKKLGEVFEIGSSKRIMEKDWAADGVPFYGGKEIVKLSKYGFVVSNSYISEEKYNEYASKYDMPKHGDILITARGTIGVGYIVKKDDKFYYKDGNIISMRAKIPTNPEFILYGLKSNAINVQLRKLTGATVSHLPIEKAKHLVLMMPDLSTQNNVVQKIQEIESETQQLEDVYQKKIANLEELKKSILKKAFTGELITEKMVLV